MIFKINMNNISFKSRIILTSPRIYQKASMQIPAKNFISHPWTPAQGVLSNCVETSKVSDCEFVGITDGERILGGHFDPLNVVNKTFSNIVSFFNKNIKQMGDKSYLQAVIIGGKAPRIAGEESYRQIYNTIDFFKREGIPYSLFMGGIGECDICYFSHKDEYIIGTDAVDKLGLSEDLAAEEAFNKVFDKVEVSSDDEIIFQKTWF